MSVAKVRITSYNVCYTKLLRIASTNGSIFYSAARSYHLFHTCHQYAAEALREAGLPVSPFWALGRSSLAWQLRRAEEMGHPQ